MEWLKQNGSKSVEKDPADVLDRLKLAMSGGNFEITAETEGAIEFRHGTFITQTASLFPKRGSVQLVRTDDGSGTEISYVIEPYGFPTYWLLFFGILTCWLIFPPILIHRILVFYPKRVMENLLRGV